MESAFQAQSAIEGPDVEMWDDADFDGLDEVQFRTASTTASVVSHPQAHHRDSISSRMSIRSDSNHGDENWDVLVDEQASIKDAVALARSKGIPLPANVPRSALEGGRIRRLQGKQIKKAIADDWSEDLDFTDAPSQLKLAKPSDKDLSETLRNISAAFQSSPKSPGSSRDGFDTVRSTKLRLAPAPISLDRFRDDEDEGFGDVPTIRVAKHRSPRKDLVFSPVSKGKPEMENIEEDLEFPTDGQLRLSTNRLVPKTPQQTEEFDVEWAEGSLGTRHAGQRGVTSNRSSSVSALSPSVSSAFTGESDDGLDGLILPSGPIPFEDLLRKSQKSVNATEQHLPPQTRSNKRPAEEDWAEDIVIPDGDVFDSRKLTLNRNIQHRSQRPQSPGKRSTTTLNFTSKQAQGTISRLPRFQDRHADRQRSHLEPVSETGAPIQRYQRPGSRLGHSVSASVSAIPAPSLAAPSTPSRRGLRNAESRPDMRYEPTTTNAQLLRAKRSLPVIQNLQSPTKTAAFQRPLSRHGTSSRTDLSRPKTPIERSESRLGDRKAAAPFLPAGSSTSQSQHASQKPALRHTRRNDSDGSGESMSAAQRSSSRLAGVRPETPGQRQPALTASQLAAQAKKTITKPSRRRNFGDGSELEIFDDLPTSATTESRYIKQPIGRGPPRSLRSRLGQHQFAASNTSLASSRQESDTPQPTTPLTPMKQDFSVATQSKSSVPRFAQDTAASRNAREQRQISTAFHNIRGEPLQPISANWKAQISNRPTSSLRHKKRNVQQKPHLIKPMGDQLNRPKEEKGMSYNPVLFRWEGNENALAPFDVPEFNPRGQSPVLQSGKVIHTGSGSPNNKSNMALIMNVGGSAGVQVVGGMVFDPQQMKWLKVAEGQPEGIRSGGGSLQLEEEEDVFAGLEDLKEETDSTIAGRLSDRPANQPVDVFGAVFVGEPEVGDVGNNSGHSSDEWGVAEEFDVGPDFIRRQRTEEDRWRRKVEKWLRGEQEAVAEDIEGPGGWRWEIREMVCGGIDQRI